MLQFFESLNFGQVAALLGAAFSFVMFFINGAKEKAEGKAEGRRKEREEWQEREAEAHRIIERAEDETIDMVDAVESNVNDRASGDTDSVRERGYRLPRHHYEG